MEIRKAIYSDRDEWCRMRNTLWQDMYDEHLQDINNYFSNNVVDITDVFVIDRGDNKLGGFIEIFVRNFAEGSKQREVPYIEGWFIDEDLRGKGWGKQLMQTAENWAIENGFNEIASDTETFNTRSIAVHKKLGFQETVRIVCFLKKL